MDEQMIADAREWVVLPCKDRTGKHVSSWDICTNQLEPDAIGVGVVASVYSGEATARAILAAVQAHSVIAGKVAELEEVLRAIIGNANEAMPFGPFDCIDNNGNPYPSQAFADALKAGRDYFARAALAPYPERRSE